ncbi:hypothetical protein ACVWZ8_004334 [Arthrobacter sp. UYCu723]
MDRLHLANKLTAALARQWRNVDFGNIAASVLSLTAPMAYLLVSAQEAAARQSVGFMGAVDDFYGISSDAQINPGAFAGMNEDGQGVDSAMLFSSQVMFDKLATGAGPDDVLRAGGNFVSATARTALLDSGRTADRVQMFARPEYKQWVRQIGPGACSRCIMLAGMSSWRKAFARHPNCHCVAVPAGETFDAAIETTPKAYFDSLSQEEQARRFTKAGAHVIREGADISRVVNARRGALGIKYGPRIIPEPGKRSMLPRNIGTQDKPIWVYETVELTGKRARKTYSYGSLDKRLPQGTRLMPETIVKIARGDRARLNDLLRHYGYII